MFIKVNNDKIEKYPYNLADFKKENSNTSFHYPISDSVLNSYGVYRVTILPIPEYDRLTQSISNSGPELIDGAWINGWTVVNIPQEQAEDNVRNQRDKLLSKTDWWTMSDRDVEMTQEEKDYRKALRDITQQDGFPFDVIWPEII